MSRSPRNKRRGLADRKQAEDELRESYNLLAKINETAPVGLCVTNEELRFVHVNRAYCDLVGYAPEALAIVRPFFPPDLRPYVSRIVEALKD